MFAGTREFIKFIWPVLECLILASLIGYEFDRELATSIVVFIFMIAINFIYKHGYVIRILGWGVYGLFLGPEIFLLNWLLLFLFALTRYLLGLVYQKLAS